MSDKGLWHFGILEEEEVEVVVIVEVFIVEVVAG